MTRHLDLGLGEEACDTLFQTLVHTSPDGIVICALDGRVQYLSEAGMAMYGVSGEDLARGLNLYDHITPDDLPKARHFLGELLAGRPSGFAEYRVLRRDGTVFWNEANANILPGEAGQADRIFLIFRDITRRKGDEEQLRQYAKDLEELNRKLVELSSTDPLTGLLNRRQLDVHLELERSRAERSGREFSLALIDIDHFKAFNDAYGHLAGDQVLMAVSALVRTAVRRADLVFRFGGEELVVLLPDTSVAQALAPLEKLRSLVGGQGLAFKGRTLPPVTISIGVAASGPLPRTGEELIDAADQALYRAKADGRNRVVLGD